MKKQFAPIFFLLACAPAAAVDHDFVEASYFQGSTVHRFGGLTFDTDFDGWKGEGSKAFGPWLLVVGHEQLQKDSMRFEGNLQPGNLPQWDLQFKSAWTHLGTGYVFRFDRSAFIATFGYAHESTEAGFIYYGFNGQTTDYVSDIDKGGYFAGFTARNRLTDNLEAEIGIERRDAELRRTTTHASLRYHVMPSLALSIDWQNIDGDFLDGDNAYGASLRFNY